MFKICSKLMCTYSVLGNFTGQNNFSKIVALIVLEVQIILEVDKNNLECLNLFNIQILILILRGNYLEVGIGIFPFFKILLFSTVCNFGVK